MKTVNLIVTTVFMCITILAYFGIIYLFERFVSSSPEINFKRLLISSVLSILCFVAWAINQTLIMRKFKVMIREMERGNTKELRINN